MEFWCHRFQKSGATDKTDKPSQSVPDILVGVIQMRLDVFEESVKQFWNPPFLLCQSSL